MYKFMSIGSSCACLGFLGDKRIRGPVDNMVSTKGASSFCVKSLLDGSIVDEIINNPPLGFSDRYKQFPTDSDKAYIYKSYTVCHNDPTTEKFKKEFLKRYETFKEFYSHIREPEYYFTYSFCREIDKDSHLVNKVTMTRLLDTLKELSFLDKIIFVSTRTEKEKNNKDARWWDFYATDIDEYVKKYNLKHLEIVDNIIHSKAAVEQFQTKVSKLLAQNT